MRFCDPDWIRTNDPQLRRLMLYPTELPDHCSWRCKTIKIQAKSYLVIWSPESLPLPTGLGHPSAPALVSGPFGVPIYHPAT